NLEFATVYVGVLPIAIFGGAFWPTVIALVLGSALGSLTHAILSSWGPKFGVPQMVQARGAFGFLGNFLPAGLNTFTAGVGWFIVNSVSGAFALQSLFGWHFWIGYLLVIAAQVGVAFIGHNFVHVFERAVFPYLTIVFAIATVVILTKTHYGAGFATLHGTSSNPTTNFTHPLGHALGDAVLVGIAIGAVAANVLNIYSGAMSFLTLGIRLPLRLRRALVALASGSLGLAIGLIYKAQVGPGSHYENFLLAITYWISPYLAVVLFD